MKILARSGFGAVVVALTACLGCSSSSSNPPDGGDGGGEIIDAGPGARIITVVSQCDQNVAVGVNGGYVQECAADGSCPQGTTCLATRNPPGCFWAFPVPVAGSGVLSKGMSATYVLDAPPIQYTVASGPQKGQTFPVKWSGNVYASTHCAADGTSCQTGVCSVSTNGQASVEPCPNGVGPQGPTTLAEFTFSPTGVDFYDISIINGVNVPISMAPVGGAANQANPYTCGVAGGEVASAGLSACTWHFDPTVSVNAVETDQSTLLRVVAPGSTMCSSDEDCASGQLCGRELRYGVVTANQVCGAPIGWWTADELCIYTTNGMGAPISCSAAVSGQGTNADLYGCNGANPTSCYQQSPPATCCGCPSWASDGTPLPTPVGFTCNGTNDAWTSVAEPWAGFLKNACPTAYSFPFDDATSTFTCSATASPSASNPNSTGYTITLCPGGKDGTN
jgi:Thaumatin family